MKKKKKKGRFWLESKLEQVVPSWSLASPVYDLQGLALVDGRRIIDGIQEQQEEEGQACNMM